MEGTRIPVVGYGSGKQGDLGFRVTVLYLLFLSSFMLLPLPLLVTVMVLVVVVCSLVPEQ